MAWALMVEALATRPRRYTWSCILCLRLSCCLISGAICMWVRGSVPETMDDVMLTENCSGD